MGIARIARHVLMPDWMTRRRFPPAALAEIETAIREAEARHEGEIRFAVETALELPELIAGVTPRQRALRAFGELGVWDTAGNNGVLIYVLMADRDVEIVADRGIASRVAAARWEAVCHELETRFRAGEFGAGAVAAVRAVGAILAEYFPRTGGDANELPNQPVLL